MVGPALNVTLAVGSTWAAASRLLVPPGPKAAAVAAEVSPYDVTGRRPNVASYVANETSRLLAVPFGSMPAAVAQGTMPPSMVDGDGAPVPKSTRPTSPTAPTAALPPNVAVAPVARLNDAKVNCTVP